MALNPYECDETLEYYNDLFEDWENCYYKNLDKD